jgi:hypothetical protein
MERSSYRVGVAVGRWVVYSPSMNNTMSNNILTDEEFLAAVEACSLERFGHVDHLRMAFAYLRRDGVDALPDNCGRAIRRLAEAGGMPDKYDEQLTLRWVRRVADAAADPPASSFDELLAFHPELLWPADGQ